MKELDLMLGEWLEQRWPYAEPGEREAFQWLLEQPDPVLADWLLGGGRPADATHAMLVDEIIRLRA